MVLTIFVFLIILGVLVFVHEMGHFVTARRNGVKVNEFGLGFPPRAIGVQFIADPKRPKIGKWRIIWGNQDGDDDNEKKDLSEAHESHSAGGTIYSLNWIPIGGFVKIKGEDGQAGDEPDSFSAQKPWVKFKILFAGVAMNFILAWLIISGILMTGAPEMTETTNNNDAKIQITQVLPNSPAEKMGMKTGDEILPTENYKNIGEFQSYVQEKLGESITIAIKRGETDLFFSGDLRKEIPAGEGALGIGLTEVVVKHYSWFQALWLGFWRLLEIIMAMLVGLWEILKSLFDGSKSVVEVSGPIGIANFTGQALILGWVYVMQLVAVLSINLGVINILPIPALDGGRILFVAIEKIKGRPVSQRIEQGFHSAGFFLLILLMVLVTFRDVYKFIK